MIENIVSNISYFIVVNIMGVKESGNINDLFELTRNLRTVEEIVGFVMFIIIMITTLCCAYGLLRMISKVK